MLPKMLGRRFCWLPFSLSFKGTPGLYLFDQWDAHPAKIAQLELVVVLMALAFYAPYVRQPHGLWFIDNIAALMALIKGRSFTRELDRMAGAVHAILCGLGCAPYFEWVQSADNCGVMVLPRPSRLVDEIPLFSPYTVSAPLLLLLLDLPVPVLVRSFPFSECIGIVSVLGCQGVWIKPRVSCTPHSWKPVPTGYCCQQLLDQQNTKPVQTEKKKRGFCCFAQV